MRFAEINLFGVYVAPISVMMVAAWLIVILLRRLADSFGLLSRAAFAPGLFFLAHGSTTAQIGTGKVLTERVTAGAETAKRGDEHAPPVAVADISQSLEQGSSTSRDSFMLAHRSMNSCTRQP